MDELKEIQNTKDFDNKNKELINKSNDFVAFSERPIEEMDAFISRVFGSIPVDVASRHNGYNVQEINPHDQFAQDGLQDFFLEDGLSAIVFKRTQLDPRLTIKGEEVKFEGDEYTDVEFLPGGRDKFKASKITESLAKGISGLTKLLAAIDRGNINIAPILVGRTNINMALIAQRLGFSIVDQCRTPNRELDKALNIYTIVGKIENVREKVKEFQQLGVSDRLLARQQRLMRKSQMKLNPSES